MSIVVEGYAAMKLLSLCDFGQLQLLRQLEFFCAFCADFMRFRDTGVN